MFPSLLCLDHTIRLVTGWLSVFHPSSLFFIWQMILWIFGSMIVGSMTRVSVPFLSLIDRTRLWLVRSNAVGVMADVSAPSLSFIVRIFFWFIRLTLVEVMTHTDPFGIRWIDDLWLHFHPLLMPSYPVFHWSDGSLYDSFDQRQLEAWIMSPPSFCRW